MQLWNLHLMGIMFMFSQHIMTKIVVLRRHYLVRVCVCSTALLRWYLLPVNSSPFFITFFAFPVTLFWVIPELMNIITLNLSRNFPSYGIWLLPASTYFLPSPCTMCISALHFCCSMCDVSLAIFWCYTSGSSFCCYSTDEIQEISKGTSCLHWSYWRLLGINSLTFFSMKVVFYCHFPDLLLAQHTTALRRIYRKPIDFIEQITTGPTFFSFSWAFFLNLCLKYVMLYSIHLTRTILSFCLSALLWPCAIFSLSLNCLVVL